RLYQLLVDALDGAAAPAAAAGSSDVARDIHDGRAAARALRDPHRTADPPPRARPCRDSRGDRHGCRRDLLPPSLLDAARDGSRAARRSDPARREPRVRYRRERDGPPGLAGGGSHLAHADASRRHRAGPGDRRVADLAGAAAPPPRGDPGLCGARTRVGRTHAVSVAVLRSAAAEHVLPEDERRSIRRARWTRADEDRA